MITKFKDKFVLSLVYGITSYYRPGIISSFSCNSANESEMD